MIAFLVRPVALFDIHIRANLQLSILLQRIKRAGWREVLAALVPGLRLTALASYKKVPDIRQPSIPNECAEALHRRTSKQRAILSLENWALHSSLSIGVQNLGADSQTAIAMPENSRYFSVEAP